MLDIKFIRENPEKVKKALKDRGVDFDLDYFLGLDEKRRAKIKEVDEARSRHNVLSEEISKAGKEERAAKIEESKQLKIKLRDSEF